MGDRLSETRPTFRAAPPIGDDVARRVRERLADRIARGIVQAEELERISAIRLRLVTSDGLAAEALRGCATHWEVNRLPPITSHRPLLGALLVPFKKALRRVFRYQYETFLDRQTTFNWNVMLVLRDVIDELERREKP